MTKGSRKGKTITSIVLADNDVLLLEAVGDFLRESGFVVHVAQDGLEALELCRREEPDCAVLDVIMPKLDGARVCWLLRQDPRLRDTFVIAFSSLSPRDYRAFPEMSADAYVAKGPLPISFQHLLSAIRRFQAGNDATVAEGIVGYEQIQPLQVVREMLEERRRHRNILRALGADVLELDLRGRIVSANPGACEILREKEANLIGRRVTDIAPPREAAVLESLLTEVGKAVEPHRCRITLRLQDQEVRVQVCAILDGQTCTGVLLVLESDGVPKRTVPWGGGV
jgi:PAS domain S-box-containing protein